MNGHVFRVLPLILLIWISGCSNRSDEGEMTGEAEVGATAAAENYYVRDGIAYDLNTNQPFTGKQIHYYENGQPAEETNFKDGNWHGP